MTGHLVRAASGILEGEAGTQTMAHPRRVDEPVATLIIGEVVHIQTHRHMPIAADLVYI